jgi:hypothetical protein
MRAICLFSLVLLLVLGASGQAIYADVGSCSTEDIVKMKKGGLSATEIRELCSDGSNSEEQLSAKPPRRGNFPRPDPGQRAPARVCATAWGICQMQVEIPVGSSCTCFNAYGQFSGVAR